MFKFLVKNGLFDPASEARHIEHCARPVDSNARKAARVSPKTNQNFNIRPDFISGFPQRVQAVSP